MRFCKIKGKFCVFATQSGYCSFTVCKGGDGMSRELKPCPFRIHGERRESLTVAGEYFYNETFMPCMGKECACFKEDSVDAYCDRNGAFMLMTRWVTE